MQLFTNNGSTTLANAVLVGDTTITVVDASKFPTGNFKVTLEAVDRSVNEIVLVTDVAGNVLTVTRAQEGTVASGFAVGSKVEVRVTAEFLNDLQALVEGVVDDTVTGTTKTWSSSKIDSTKQNTLVSGENIKTINGESVLGSGDIVTPTTTVNNTLTSTSTTEALSAAQGKVLQDSKQANLVSGTNIKTVNGTSLLGSGNVAISGSSFTVTEETLAADRTLTEADAGTWLFATITSMMIFLPATPTKDVEFNIVYVGTTLNVYLEIKCTGDTSYFTRLYAGAAAKVAFDSDTGKWTLYGNGYRVTRTGANAYSIDTAVSSGYAANGSTNGVAIGNSANGSTSGAAVGNSANGSTSGAAVGNTADGSTSGAAVGRSASGSSEGAAVGYTANGSNYGAAVGRSASGSNYGAAVGYYAAATKQYGSAIGAFSRQERYGGHARNGDHLSTSKLHVEEVHWKGVTTDATATELFLHGVSANRCILLASSVLGFTVRVTGIASTTFEVIDIELKGTIKRNASNVTTLVGTVAQVVINNELSGATATLTADDTNEALKLTVTGLAGKTINWGAVGLLLDRRI